MPVALGFAIAFAIALTGVGAGSMTTPMLIIFLGVSPATAVGTALTFGALVKVASVPMYAIRRQVNVRVLLLLLAGGVPGVLGGGFLLRNLKGGAHEKVLYAALGILIAATAAFHLYRGLLGKPRAATRDHSRILPWLALPIGAEVGFSSAGAGALGSLLLFSLTRLTTAEVVGTDLCFGLVLSGLGSLLQLTAGNYDAALLLQLTAGGLCGALAGSLLAGRIATAPMRMAVLILLVILGIQLAFHGQSPAPPIRAVLLR